MYNEGQHMNTVHPEVQIIHTHTHTNKTTSWTQQGTVKRSNRNLQFMYLFIAEKLRFKRSGNFPGQWSKQPSQRNIPPVVTAITWLRQGFNIMRWGTRKVHCLNEPERSNSSINDEWGFRRNTGSRGASPGPSTAGQGRAERVGGGRGQGRGAMTI